MTKTSSVLSLNTLSGRPGSRTARKRVGRGVGSGTGKTCGRGQKGQKSRSGVAIKGFEGGQMPIQMRLPKRGFNSHRRKRFAWVHLGRINTAIEQGKLDPANMIDEAAMVAAGLVRKRRDGIRILSDGAKITAALELSVSGASGSVVAAIEKAGGKIHLPSKAPADQAS